MFRRYILSAVVCSPSLTKVPPGSPARRIVIDPEHGNAHNVSPVNAVDGTTAKSSGAEPCLKSKKLLVCLH
jgi:hypothetical protein